MARYDKICLAEQSLGRRTRRMMPATQTVVPRSSVSRRFGTIEARKRRTSTMPRERCERTAPDQPGQGRCGRVNAFEQVRNARRQHTCADDANAQPKPEGVPRAAT